MRPQVSLLFNAYDFTEKEVEEIQHKLSDPLVRAYIQTQLAESTQTTLTTFRSDDLKKTAVDVAYLNGMIEIGGKLIFDLQPKQPKQEEGQT